jgi:hypothetical protein
MFGATCDWEQKESCLQTRTLNLHFSRLWHAERGNYIVYERTSHPPNIKTWPSIAMVCCRFISNNLEYTILLDEWEVPSYAIIPFLILVSSPNMRNKLSWQRELLHTSIPCIWTTFSNYFTSHMVHKINTRWLAHPNQGCSDFLHNWMKLGWIIFSFTYFLISSMYAWKSQY